MSAPIIIIPSTKPQPIKICSESQGLAAFDSLDPQTSLSISDMAALCCPQLQKFLLNQISCNYYGCDKHISTKKNIIVKGGGTGGRSLCSAIAIDAPSSLASLSGIRWGSVQLKGAREEMEDDVVIVQSDGLDGFAYAAVFDVHAGFSSVQFLREELYQECVNSLQGGQLLSRKDFEAIKKALQEAFMKADAKLLKWLEDKGEEDESGSTATVVFLRDDVLFIAHIGDSSVILSRSGKAEVLTDSHRPYGSNKVSLQEIRRVREAGGWISNGRICGDISVSRAFGDIRFKSKKNEMLRKGVWEGRWSEKFASRWPWIRCRIHTISIRWLVGLHQQLGSCSFC